MRRKITISKHSENCLYVNISALTWVWKGELILMRSVNTAFLKVWFKNLCILLFDATAKSFPKPITLGKRNFIFNNVVWPQAHCLKRATDTSQVGADVSGISILWQSSEREQIDEMVANHTSIFLLTGSSEKEKLCSMTWGQSVYLLAS